MLLSRFDQNSFSFVISLPKIISVYNMVGDEWYTHPSRSTRSYLCSAWSALNEEAAKRHSLSFMVTAVQTPCCKEESLHKGNETGSVAMEITAHNKASTFKYFVV